MCASNVGRGSSSCSAGSSMRSTARSWRGMPTARSSASRSGSSTSCQTQPAMRPESTPGRGRIDYRLGVDGMHDLGGRQGFGRVEAEADEPPFHEPWEGRVHGMSETAHIGPGFRHAIERMDPTAYLTTSYYEHWLESIETRGVEHGLFTREDLAAASARIAAGEPVPQRCDPDAARAARAMLRPRPQSTYTAPAPRHGVGDAVTVVRVLPAGHTRCPGYLRGARGVVERV